MEQYYAQGPKSFTKYHRPYLTPTEIDYLSEKQRGKTSIRDEERLRFMAGSRLEALGARIGLCVVTDSLMIQN
jgi:CTD kinase subunit beta